ncbi:MAG TPA: class I SAM-dependent methyltransferase, partial [Candidatus Paceibacterota bacterium]
MPDPRARAQAERYLRECTEYSSPYERDKLIANWERKEAGARSLAGDFEKRAGTLAGKRLLELGFGSGLHIPAFVERGAAVTGLEVNGVLADIARENLKERGVAAELYVYDGSRMPFEDASFDYVFATTVLEHVSDMRNVLSEIGRILVPGGRAYLSFPNRWRLKESHTGYWFVSYLPRELAARYLRLRGSNAVEELNLHFVGYCPFVRAVRRAGLSVVFEARYGSRSRRILKGLLASLGLHHSV